MSQGDDINGYCPEPHAADDPLVGPDAFLAGTEDAGVNWTLAQAPVNGLGAGFLTSRQMWLRAYVHQLSGMLGMARTDLVRTWDGGVTWLSLEGVKGLGVVDVTFQSATDGLLMAAEGNGANVLYRTVDAGVSWEPEALEPPPRLPVNAELGIDPVMGRDGTVLLVLSALSGRDSARRPKWEGRYVYRRVGSRDWAGPYRLLPMVPVCARADRTQRRAGRTGGSGRRRATTSLSPMTRQGHGSAATFGCRPSSSSLGSTRSRAGRSG